MQDVKVLLVANTDWYLYRFRLSLAQYLADHGCLVKCVSPAGPFVTKLRENGFEWLEWKVGRQSIGPLHEWNSMSRLMKIYQAEKPDVVHHHTIKPVLYGSSSARKLGIKAIINSITGSGYVFMSSDLKARVLRPVINAFYKQALKSPNCGVIFENPEDQTEFVARGLINQEQTWLVRSVGVDIQKFSPTPEPDGIPVVTLASRMLWDKGVGVFVDAARRLKSRLPVRMVLVGTSDPGNPSSIPVETLEKWAAEGVVEWVGWQEDIARVYSHSNIVVLPSFFEGLPTGLIEGAASGRALIASDIRGCREVITSGENGLLVTPGDPDSLADSIEKLASNPALRHQMGIASRMRAVQEFSAEVVNQRTFAIYQKYLGGQHPVGTRKP